VHLTRAENTAMRRLSSFPCLAPVHSRTVLSSRSQFVHPANPQQRATRELAGLASQNPLPWFVRGHGVFWLAAAAWWWHSQRQGGPIKSQRSKWERAVAMRCCYSCYIVVAPPIQLAEMQSGAVTIGSYNHVVSSPAAYAPCLLRYSIGGEN
jgi:hypothetical protein